MNFYGKNLRKKAIRPTALKSIRGGSDSTERTEDKSIEDVRAASGNVTETENNKTEIKEEIMDKSQIEKAEELVKTGKKVKIEKKDKGLYERAEVTVLTDDNKMLLKD